MAMTTTLATFPGFILLITLTLTMPCHAQNSPQDYLDAHNAVRAAVGVPDIEWNDHVAAYAQQYANQRKKDCALRHSGGPYGENIAWASDKSLTGIDAMQMWADEKVDYDYDTNTCDPGNVCGHYIQVVWRKSVRLGCARVPCNTGGTFIVCNFDPPGNVIGQKPY